MARKSSLEKSVETKTWGRDKVVGLYARARRERMTSEQIRVEVEEIIEALRTKKKAPQWVVGETINAAYALGSFLYLGDLVWCHRGPDGKLYTIDSVWKDKAPYLDANLYLYGPEGVRIPNASAAVSGKLDGWTSGHYWAGTDKLYYGGE